MAKKYGWIIARAKRGTSIDGRLYISRASAERSIKNIRRNNPLRTRIMTGFVNLRPLRYSLNDRQIKEMNLTHKDFIWL